MNSVAPENNPIDACVAPNKANGERMMGGRGGWGGCWLKIGEKNSYNFFRPLPSNVCQSTRETEYPDI